MKKSIYEIEVKHLQLAEILEENGGELTLELEEELAINEADLQTKGVAYSFVIKDIKATVNQIDEEIKRLAEMKKSKNKAIERLENSLSTAMQIFGVEKIETPIVKISFRNSESVEITNESQLAEKFTITKTTVSPDKVAIKTAIKNGEFVEGAVIVYNKNLQIK